jgi:DNA-binding NarL/FixJ family response regulator
VKLLLVDDHILFRDGLALLLRRLDAGAVILHAGSCAEALETAKAHRDVDLVLLDLLLPDAPGHEGLSQLRARYPELPVVVLSAVEERSCVMDALQRGAMGFIPKSSSTETLLDALQLVLNRGVYVPASALDANRARKPRALGKSDGTVKAPISLNRLGLSDRQIAVLALLLEGKPNKLIGRELGLAERTVKFHISAVLKALRVTSRTQAVLEVGRLGLTFARPSNEARS